MEYSHYIEGVKNNLNIISHEEIVGTQCYVSYEEVFKWRWIATKLKIFSIFKYVANIDEENLIDINYRCYEHSRKNYKGLPRGLQNGFVSFAIIVTNSISKSAINSVENWNKKHYSAFEIPVIFDLTSGKAYYNRSNIIWGKMYSNFFKQYIQNNFIISE
ncbi:MAG: hypothetical protein ACERKZ_16760 [Lachnotalea sp.]